MDKSIDLLGMLSDLTNSLRRKRDSGEIASAIHYTVELGKRLEDLDEMISGALEQPLEGLADPTTWQ